MFLSKYEVKDNIHCSIRTYQGGELAGSKAFRKLAQQHNYTVKTTGADSYSQNGIGDLPHRMYENMVRCLLYSSSLGTEFRSDALMHSCYILNQTYHTATKQTPYEAWGGNKPDLKHMRTFGTPVTVKKPGHRPSKGHPHVYHGIFLRFTEAANNIVYYDVDTGTIKVATHKLHDEFQYSSDRNKRSHASRYIIDLIADDTDEKRYGQPMIDGKIVNIIPIDAPPSTAAAATTVAYDINSQRKYICNPNYQYTRGRIFIQYFPVVRTFFTQPTCFI